jgi:hypothetical protein
MKEHKCDNLVLDRAFVVESAIFQNEHKREGCPASSIQLPLNYEHWLYESDGVSAIEHVLRSNQDWNCRLVSIPTAVVNQITIELRQLEYLIAEWSKSTLIERSVQLFKRSSVGHSRSTIDHLSYLLRILFLSQKFNADILPWWPRVQLFKSFFETVGFHIDIRDLDTESTILIASGEDVSEVPVELRHVFRLNLSLSRKSHRPKNYPEELPVKIAKGRNETERLIFLSYSHSDKAWFDRLILHLTPLLRSRRIAIWSDRDIKPGDNWQAEIADALTLANVAVLLVSPNYIASDFIANHELPPLLEKAQKGGVKILWIAVSSSLYEETDIEKYQAANDPRQPLDLMSPAMRNRELVKICKFIRDA